MDEMLIPQLEKILEDEKLRISLSDNIKKLALPNASIEIVNEIELLLK
jgi:predicted nucleotidyltransferase